VLQSTQTQLKFEVGDHEGMIYNFYP
jgi:hypothetical protein